MGMFSNVNAVRKCADMLLIGRGQMGCSSVYIL
jgi:hypothetical protein